MFFKHCFGMPHVSMALCRPFNSADIGWGGQQHRAEQKPRQEHAQAHPCGAYRGAQSGPKESCVPLQLEATALCLSTVSSPGFDIGSNIKIGIHHIFSSAPHRSPGQAVCLVVPVPTWKAVRLRYARTSLQGQLSWRQAAILSCRVRGQLPGSRSGRNLPSSCHSGRALPPAATLSMATLAALLAASGCRRSPGRATSHSRAAARTARTAHHLAALASTSTPATQSRPAGEQKMQHSKHVPATSLLPCHFLATLVPAFLDESLLPAHEMAARPLSKPLNGTPSGVRHIATCCDQRLPATPLFA